MKSGSPVTPSLGLDKRKGIDIHWRPYSHNCVHGQCPAWHAAMAATISTLGVCLEPTTTGKGGALMGTQARLPMMTDANLGYQRLVTSSPTTSLPRARPA